MAKFRIEKRHWKISDSHQYYKYSVQIKTFWGWRYLSYLSTLDKFITEKYETASPYTSFTSRLECIELINQYNGKGLDKKSTYEYLK